MSFSKDENNIWFNDKVYGVIYFKNLHNLNNGSTNEEITKIIGAPTQEHFNHLYDFIIRGGIISIMEQYDFYPCICNINNGETKTLLLKTINYRDKLNYERYLFTLVNNTWTCNVVRRIIIEDIISDIYKSALGTSIQMSNTVGGIAAGTTVATLNGKKQNQIIDMILFPEQQPQVVAPSATILLSSGFINNEIMEVGMAAPVAGTNIKTAFNQGYGRVAGQPDKKRAGALNSEASFIYYGGQESNKTLPTKVVLGTMQYNYHAAYAQGEQLVTSWGNKASVQPNPLPAGTVNSAAVYIYGTYPYFVNGADASTSNGDGNMPSVPVPNNKLKLYKRN